MTDQPSAPVTARLRFERFVEADAEGLAALLADPEIARTITTDGSTPERCLASARARIAWHNGAWASHGYGVWALRARNPDGEGDRLLGWCGFGPPDVPSEGPEILYGLARDHWGRGLGTAAAAAALAWLFKTTTYPEASALVMARLNPHSIGVAEKLGMARRGTLPFAEFLSSEAMARSVLDYEVWRLREGLCLDPEALLFQVPYKAGQVVGIGIEDAAKAEAALQEAALARGGYAARDPASLRESVSAAFGQGLRESYVDWYCVSREAWRER